MSNYSNLCEHYISNGNPEIGGCVLNPKCIYLGLAREHKEKLMPHCPVQRAIKSIVNEIDNADIELGSIEKSL